MRKMNLYILALKIYATKLRLIRLLYYLLEMEKLIELLNEFEKEVYADEHEHIEYPDWTWDDWEYWFEWDSSILGEEDWLNWSWSDYRCYNSDLVIISKRYWFIDWLVKNDKINEVKLSCVWTDDMQYYYSEEDILLMLLSIQDNSIEFLVSILK